MGGGGGGAIFKGSRIWNLKAAAYGYGGCVSEKSKHECICCRLEHHSQRAATGPSFLNVNVICRHEETIKSDARGGRFQHPHAGNAGLNTRGFLLFVSCPSLQLLRYKISACSYGSSLYTIKKNWILFHSKIVKRAHTAGEAIR